MRTRHGEGDHVRKRASGLALLLICSSTSISLPLQVRNDVQAGRRSNVPC
jgi:hypothetical protein